MCTNTPPRRPTWSSSWRRALHSHVRHPHFAVFLLNNKRERQWVFMHFLRLSLPTLTTQRSAYWVEVSCGSSGFPAQSPVHPVRQSALQFARHHSCFPRTVLTVLSLFPLEKKNPNWKALATYRNVSGLDYRCGVTVTQYFLAACGGRIRVFLRRPPAGGLPSPPSSPPLHTLSFLLSCSFAQYKPQRT